MQQTLLASRLVSMGHDVSMLVRETDALREPTRINGVRVLPFAYDWAGGSKHRLPAGLASLAGGMRSAGRGLFVIKLPRVLLGPIGLVARALRSRLVFWLTSDRDVELDDVAGIGGKGPLLAYRLGLRLVHHAIAQNDYQLERIGRMGVAATHLPSLVEVGPPDWAGRKEPTPVVLWVGSHTHKGRKHPELLFELARMLPHVRFEMIAVTDSPERDRELRSRADAARNVGYLGKMPLSEMGHHYLRAALFVSTSGLEGFPNVFLQSWANGTPTVSLHVNPDRILDREGIGICTDGDLRALSAQIESLLAAPALRIDMAQRAYAYVAGRHGTEQVAPRYEALFQEVLSPRRRG